MTIQQVNIMDDNSRQAYAKAYKRLDTLRYRVFTTIADNPGLMDDQIAAELRTPLNSITGRVKELKDAGLIVCTDDRNARGNTARRSYLKGERMIFDGFHWTELQTIINKLDDVRTDLRMLKEDGRPPGNSELLRMARYLNELREYERAHREESE